MHGGVEAKQTPMPAAALLHTLHKSRDPLIAYREGYGGTSTRLYGGARILPNCTATFFSLQPTNQPTPMTTTTAAPAAAAAFFPAENRSF